MGSGDETWDLLEAERPDAVLARLDALAAGGRPHPDAQALAALAHLDLGDVEAAERALGGTRPAEDDAGRALARGELLLLTWRTDAARRAFEHGHRLAPSAHLCLRLALVADLAADRAAAERWTRAAVALDPDAAPVHVDAAAFERLVSQAADELPPAFAARLEAVPVLVDPVPALADTGPDVPPDALGLFRGANDLDGAGEGFVDLPAAIHLFQRNLERRARDADELREEIRITLFHELGHLLGFDEDGVDALGLA